MSGIARIGADAAGGTIITGSTDTFVNGAGVARIGDVIQPHGDGEHQNSVLITGSSTVFVNGIPLCRAGDISSCGHPTSGSSDTSAG
jgi:uncharacterized Zn-binding protein involved in type VI secretion